MKIDEIMKDFNKKYKEELAHVGVASYDYVRIPFTSPRLNYMSFGGIPVGKLVEFYGEEHGGKALVNGSPVLTEFGWMPIEQLNIGDKVFGEDGKLHNVLGVFPQGKKDCYKFTLRDGTSVECSGDHLWSVYTEGQMKHLHYRNCKPYVKTTKDILDSLDKGYYLPDISAIEFAQPVELLIDPYLLGLLLGDGCILGGTPHFTNSETDIVEQMSALVKDYNCTLKFHKKIHKFHKRPQCDYRIVENTKSNNHPINLALRQYDLLGRLGRHSQEKFIPNIYKFASINDRYRLIAGLINTEGWVCCGIVYESTSSQLLQDFWEICMSLGIYCVRRKHTVRIPPSSMTEELLKLLSIKHTMMYEKCLECPIMHIHKHRREVKSIEYIGDKECTCIKVDNPTSLFITNEYIPTHNTTTALDVVANYQNMFDRKVLYIDAENTLDVVWATKLGVSVSDMIILNPTSQGAEDIFQFILDMIDTGEIGLVVIDSLGVMVSNQAMEKDVSEKTYGGISMALTQFSKKAEGLCQRHKCTIIGINQMRDDLNSMYGGLTTTGGRAWKHNVSARFEFRRGQFFDAKGNKLTRGAENPQGNEVLVSMTKNKTCPPTRRTGFYTLRYDIGIDYITDLIQVAMKYGIIEQSGAWFQIIDVLTGEMLSDKLQGQSKIVDLLNNDTSMLKKVEELVDAEMKRDS